MSHPAKNSFHLVLYPGESKKNVVVKLSTGDMAVTVTMGHIYVVDSSGKVVGAFDIAGGPPPGTPKSDPKKQGGHTAGPTPTGRFVLAEKEHHVTENWPYSVVPFGAKLREVDGIVEYQRNGAWLHADGKHGKVTHAWMVWATKSDTKITLAQASAYAHEMFYDDSGKLKETWDKNDFGKWSWNLTRHGHRTAIYLHTTPEDEASTANKLPFDLMNSHACVHVRPADRDVMEAKKYLKKGVLVIVHKYGEVGPPK